MSLVALLIAVSLSVLGLLDNNFLSIYIYIVLSTLALYYTNERSLISLIAALGFSLFIITPAFLSYYYMDKKLDLFFMTAICYFYLIFLFNRFDFVGMYNPGLKNSIVFFIVSLFISLLFLFLYYPIFVGFMPFLITKLAEINLNKTRGFYFNSFMYLMFLLVYLIFLLFVWSGFGRLVVAGVLLTLIFVYFMTLSIKINKYIFSAVASLGPLLLTNRNNFSDLTLVSFEGALNDSAYQPYVLASSFLEKINDFDLSGLIDQWVFTFFVFIPRSIWESKPNGFGYEYTVQNLEQYLVDSGHSVAGTLLGEHIYYVGYFGLVSCLVFIYLLYVFTLSLYKRFGFSLGASVIVATSMFALFWGGMSSFSTRIITGFVVYIILNKIQIVFNRR